MSKLEEEGLALSRERYELVQLRSQLEVERAELRRELIFGGG
ncbi:MAG: hypothetical protein ABWK01_01395 [Infirmifilum sp.]